MDIFAAGVAILLVMRSALHVTHGVVTTVRIVPEIIYVNRMMMVRVVPKTISFKIVHQGVQLQVLILLYVMGCQPRLPQLLLPQHVPGRVRHVVQIPRLLPDPHVPHQGEQLERGNGMVSQQVQVVLRIQMCIVTIVLLPYPPHLLQVILSVQI